MFLGLLLVFADVEEQRDDATGDAGRDDDGPRVDGCLTRAKTPEESSPQRYREHREDNGIDSWSLVIDHWPSEKDE